MRLLLSILMILIFVPAWSGTPRLPLIARDVVVHASGFVPAGGWPRRIGALEPVGAVRLSADDPAFGGFSAMAIRGEVLTLLSDGGNWVRLATRQGRVATLGAGALTEGPGSGWAKETRDTESLTGDPAGRTWWIGYERANAIWRYAGDLHHAEGGRAPAAMRWWSVNKGAESLVRLRDGRFVAIAEGRGRRPGRLGPADRPALLFDSDPAAAGTRVDAFAYRAPDGFAPSDATELPGGDLLVLNRRFRFPRFSAKLVQIPRAALRAGAVVRGREIATLDGDLLGENAEGLAITREKGATMLWIVTDNDTSAFRPTILAKFRLHGDGFDQSVVTRETPVALTPVDRLARMVRAGQRRLLGRRV